MTDSATITREDAGKDIPVAKLAVASTIGTIIEAYDFVLYGTVAALVFDKLFFPDATPLVATLASFATFGVGFLARPVGGAIFGHYGDKVGRKKMLVLALVIMGVATVCIGALPGYNSIGIAAPILLVLLRLIQGAALGGEWGGAVLMVTEYAPKGKRGFYGSWPQIGFAGGLAISTAIIWIMSSSLSDAAFQSWGWRVPFFASVALVAFGLWIRIGVEETPLFKQIEQITIDKQRIFEQGSKQKAPELRKALAQDFELKTQEQLMRRRKGDVGKARLARRLRQETTMTLAWIAERLSMGSASTVAQSLRRNC